jgi:hypothetical protein
LNPVNRELNHSERTIGSPVVVAGNPLGRRQFLVAGAGLVVATACSSKKKKEGDVSTVGDANRIAVVQASAQLLSGVDQRVAIAIFKGEKPVDQGSATVRFGRNQTALGDPLPAVLHKDGIDTRPYFATTTRFTEPGIWIAQASWNGQQGSTRLEVIDPASTQVPVPGKAMIATPTPTPEDPKGVNPICTADPICPLHDMSLDAALGQHRPMAVLFGTPAFCQTRTCGPVLDVLLSQRDAFSDRVHLLHVETQPQATTYAPALSAYHLEFEPILFLAGADGIVKSRLDGPFDRAELRESLQALVS